ncbi:MAG TPA: hypothetical protein VHZ97_14815, partial [Pseudonocardiaceae bacterium]|nr:hypothetical protein [Pseudonocardiaceae bacterium]
GSIPAAHNVLELKITNQTNGQYPDSQVYWSFNGQTESIAQQPYIDMPANSAGRMYFYLGSPTVPTTTSSNSPWGRPRSTWTRREWTGSA